MPMAKGIRWSMRWAVTAFCIDGNLEVNSPATTSTFTTQDGLLVGYALAAGTAFLSGMLDDFTIYG